MSQVLPFDKVQSLNSPPMSSSPPANLSDDEFIDDISPLSHFHRCPSQSPSDDEKPRKLFLIAPQPSPLQFVDIELPNSNSKRTDPGKITKYKERILSAPTHSKSSPPDHSNVLMAPVTVQQEAREPLLNLSSTQKINIAPSGAGRGRILTPTSNGAAGKRLKDQGTSLNELQPCLTEPANQTCLTEPANLKEPPEAGDFPAGVSYDQYYTSDQLISRPPTKYADFASCCEESEDTSTANVDPITKKPLRVDSLLGTIWKPDKKATNGTADIAPAFFCRYYEKSMKINRRLRFVDTHCHLDLIAARANVSTANFDRLKAKHHLSWSPNFAGCIADFCFPETFMADRGFFDEAVKHAQVWAAIGCHPHQADRYDEPGVREYIAERARSPKVVAIGELGLDYSQNNSVDHEVQKKCLRAQLTAAMMPEFGGKPLLVHCRDAHEDCFEIFKEIVPKDYPIHWHCFSNSIDVATKWCAYFTRTYFGVTTGVMTPRVNQEQFWSRWSLNRLLIETDAPYFLPRWYRNVERLGSLEFNHPGMGGLVAQKLAELKKMDARLVAETLLNNTRALYKIDVDMRG